jgi:hypothetical protein
MPQQPIQQNPTRHVAPTATELDQTHSTAAEIFLHGELERTGETDKSADQFTAERIIQVPRGSRVANLARKTESWEGKRPGAAPATYQADAGSVGKEPKLKSP